MTLERMLTEQRKLFVVLLVLMVLVGGFGVVVWRPAALEPYRVLAEWVVYLAGFFGGANALSYWAQKKGAAK